MTTHWRICKIKLVIIITQPDLLYKSLYCTIKCSCYSSEDCCHKLPDITFPKLWINNNTVRTERVDSIIIRISSINDSEPSDIIICTKVWNKIYEIFVNWWYFLRLFNLFHFCRSGTVVSSWKLFTRILSILWIRDRLEFAGSIVPSAPGNLQHQQPSPSYYLLLVIVDEKFVFGVEY